VSRRVVQTHDDVDLDPGPPLRAVAGDDFEKRRAGGPTLFLDHGRRPREVAVDDPGGIGMDGSGDGRSGHAPDAKHGDERLSVDRGGRLKVAPEIRLETERDACQRHFGRSVADRQRDRSRRGGPKAWSVKHATARAHAGTVQAWRNLTILTEDTPWAVPGLRFDAA